MMKKWFSNWRKTAEQKELELLTAYVDQMLSPTERAAFEQRLANDQALQNRVEQHQKVQSLLGKLPELSVPRNFTLDPARFAAPQLIPWWARWPQMQPVMGMAGLFFIFAFFFLNFNQPRANFTLQGSSDLQSVAEAPLLANEPQAEMAFETEAAADNASAAASAPLADENNGAGSPPPLMPPATAGEAEIKSGSSDSELVSDGGDSSMVARSTDDAPEAADDGMDDDVESMAAAENSDGMSEETMDNNALGQAADPDQDPEMKEAAANSVEMDQAESMPTAPAADSGGVNLPLWGLLLIGFGLLGLSGWLWLQKEG